MAQVQQQQQQQVQDPIGDWKNYSFRNKKPRFYEVEATVNLMGQLALASGLIAPAIAFKVAVVTTFTPVIVAVASFALAYFFLSQTEFKKDPEWLNKAGKKLWDAIKIERPLPKYEDMKKQFDALGITLCKKDWGRLLQTDCNRTLKSFVDKHDREAVSVLSKASKDRLCVPFVNLSLEQLKELDDELNLDDLGLHPQKMRLIQSKLQERIEGIRKEPLQIFTLFSQCPLAFYFPNLNLSQQHELYELLLVAIPLATPDLLWDEEDSEYLRSELMLLEIDLKQVATLRQNRPLPADLKYEDFFQKEMGDNLDYLKAFIAGRDDLKEKLKTAFLDCCYQDIDEDREHIKILGITPQNIQDKMVKDAKDLPYKEFKEKYFDDNTSLESFLKQNGDLKSVEENQQGGAERQEVTVKELLRDSFLQYVRKSYKDSYLYKSGLNNFDDEYAVFDINDSDLAKTLKSDIEKEWQKPPVLWEDIYKVYGKVLKVLVADLAFKESCRKRFMASPVAHGYQDKFCTLLDIKPEEIHDQMQKDAKKLSYSSFRTKYMYGVKGETNLHLFLFYIGREKCCTISPLLQARLAAEIVNRCCQTKESYVRVSEEYRDDRLHFLKDDVFIQKAIEPLEEYLFLNTVNLISFYEIWGDLLFSFVSNDEIKKQLKEAFMKTPLEEGELRKKYIQMLGFSEEELKALSSQQVAAKDL